MALLQWRCSESKRTPTLQPTLARYNDVDFGFDCAYSAEESHFAEPNAREPHLDLDAESHLIHRAKLHFDAHVENAKPNREV